LCFRPNNVISENVNTEAAIGVLRVSGVSGNVIAGNRFFDTPVSV